MEDPRGGVRHCVKDKGYFKNMMYKTGESILNS
jgi:hypothetical protein